LAATRIIATPGRVAVLREADHDAVGVRPDDGDLPDVSAERKQAALVLQQRDSLVRESPRQLIALAGAGADLDRVLGDVGILEEPERELVPQDAPHRLVQLRLGQQAALDGPDERAAVAVRGWPMPATWPMPSPRRVWSWPRIGPSGPRRASGTTEESCIAFSSMVISRNSSSARCMGVVVPGVAMSGSFPSRPIPPGRKDHGTQRGESGARSAGSPG